MKLALLAENMIQYAGLVGAGDRNEWVGGKYLTNGYSQYSPVILYKSISRQIHQSPLSLDLILLEENLGVQSTEWSNYPSDKYRWI